MAAVVPKAAAGDRWLLGGLLLAPAVGLLARAVGRRAHPRLRWAMVSMDTVTPSPPPNLMVYRQRPVPTIAPDAPMEEWEKQFILSHRPFLPHRELLLDWVFERREAKQTVLWAAGELARASRDPESLESASPTPLLAAVAPGGSGKTTLLLLVWKAWAADVAAAIREQRPEMDEPLFLFATFVDHSSFHLCEESLSAHELLVKRLWASYRGVRGVWEPAYLDASRPPELERLSAFTQWVRQQEARRRGQVDPLLIPLVLLVDEVSRPPVVEGAPSVIGALAELQQEDLRQHACTVAVATSNSLLRVRDALAVPGVTLHSVQLPPLGPKAQGYCVQQLKARFTPNVVPGALMRAHRRMAFEVACSAGQFPSVRTLMDHDFNQRNDKLGHPPDEGTIHALVEVLLWQLGSGGAGCGELQRFGDIPLLQLVIPGWVLYRRVDAAAQLLWPEVIPNAMRWIPMTKYRPKPPSLTTWAEDQLWIIYKVLGEGEPRPVPNAWQQSIRPTADNERAAPLDALELWRVLPPIELIRAYALLKHGAQPPSLQDVLPGALVKPWPGDKAIQVQAAVATNGVHTPAAQQKFSIPSDPLLCQTAHRHSRERQVRVVLSMYDAIDEDESRRPVLMLQQMRLQAISTSKRVLEWARFLHSRATDEARSDCLHLPDGAFYAVVFYVGDPLSLQEWEALPPGTVLAPVSTVRALLAPFGGWPLLLSLRSVVAHKEEVRQHLPAPPPPYDADPNKKPWRRRRSWPQKLRPLTRKQRWTFWKTGHHPQWWRPQVGLSEWER
eukprot:GGOE01000171.1.p1 GENE.GGOE01000171.1~~GGOE01000171.1.p1  ORF type:complete len:892 (-),score=160.54 GGOE01000171.1:246-2597(-)